MSPAGESRLTPGTVVRAVGRRIVHGRASHDVTERLDRILAACQATHAAVVADTQRVTELIATLERYATRAGADLETIADHLASTGSDALPTQTTSVVPRETEA